MVEFRPDSGSSGRLSRVSESEVIRQAGLGEVVSCQRDAGRADLRGVLFSAHGTLSVILSRSWWRVRIGRRLNSRGTLFGAVIGCPRGTGGRPAGGEEGASSLKSPGTLSPGTL